MTLFDMQTKVAEDIKKDKPHLIDDRDRILELGCVGLAEEAGEVLGLLKRELTDRKSEATDDKWAEEIGDVMWYLTLVATAKNLPLEDIWENNVCKLELRYGK